VLSPCHVHAAVTNPPSPEDTSESRASAVPPGVPFRVLVVDDDDASRRALEKAVCLLGYDCRSARDGLEAWEMHQHEHADVILSDWQMPRMDGIELCRRTRVNADEAAYTYFIFMTSFGDKDHYLRGMEAGADDYHTKPADLDELRARLVSARRVVGLYRRLADKNAVLRREGETSFRAARLDALTQISNRLSMEEDLNVLWSRANRYGQRYSIAMCDIDRFKAYNDHFGHLAGDEVLRRVAQTIRDNQRAGDGLYRYGGEEFVVLLPEQSLAEAARAMDRARRAVEGMGILTGRGAAVLTMSFGVAELERAEDKDPEDWLRRADAALYRAKALGRNRGETDPPAGTPTLK
jgi:diguanylate cyclase (GGDEF)-like protein